MSIPHIRRYSIPRLPQDHPIAKALDDFVRAIDSLELAFKYVDSQVQELIQNEKNKLQIFLSQPDIEVKIESNKRVFHIPQEKDILFDVMHRSLSKAEKANEIIPRSLLVELISQYDVLVARLIKEFMILAPQRVVVSSQEKSREKSISFGSSVKFQDIVSFSSVSEVVDSIITEVLDPLMRGSHSKQIAEISKLFNINLSTEKTGFWKTFLEITERRNLFVHTNGIVSNQYLRVCRDENITLLDSIKLGVQLTVNQDYYLKAYECVYETGIRLAHVMWRQILPGEAIKADENLSDIVLNALASEQFQMSIKLCEFAISTMDKKNITPDNSFHKYLNLAQSHKWAGNNDKCLEILDQRNWNCHDRYILGEAVLRDDYDLAFTIMCRLGDAIYPIMGEEAYRTWPIFREFRKTEKFAEAFKKIYGKEYEVTATVENQENTKN